MIPPVLNPRGTTRLHTGPSVPTLVGPRGRVGEDRTTAETCLTCAWTQEERDCTFYVNGSKFFPNTFRTSSTRSTTDLRTLGRPTWFTQQVLMSATTHRPTSGQGIPGATRGSDVGDRAVPLLRWGGSKGSPPRPGDPERLPGRSLLAPMVPGPPTSTKHPPDTRREAGRASTLDDSSPQVVPTHLDVEGGPHGWVGRHESASVPRTSRVNDPPGDKDPGSTTFALQFLQVVWLDMTDVKSYFVNSLCGSCHPRRRSRRHGESETGTGVSLSSPRYPSGIPICPGRRSSLSTDPCLTWWSRRNPVTTKEERSGNP